MLSSCARFTLGSHRMHPHVQLLTVGGPFRAEAQVEHEQQHSEQPHPHKHGFERWSAASISARDSAPISIRHKGHSHSSLLPWVWPQREQGAVIGCSSKVWAIVESVLLLHNHA